MALGLDDLKKRQRSGGNHKQSKTLGHAGGRTVAAPKSSSQQGQTGPSNGGLFVRSQTAMPWDADGLAKQGARPARRRSDVSDVVVSEEWAEYHAAAVLPNLDLWADSRLERISAVARKLGERVRDARECSHWLIANVRLFKL